MKHKSSVFRLVEIDQELRAIDELRSDRKHMRKHGAAFKKELGSMKRELWTERESLVARYSRH
jgi:hypothetical protein